MIEARSPAASPIVRAHLVLAAEGRASSESAEAVGTTHRCPITGNVTTIGSDAARDITLSSLEPYHGEIVRLDEDDEYVYRQCSPHGVSQVNGAIVTVAELHHGDRLTLGDRSLIYQLDEFVGDVPSSPIIDDNTAASQTSDPGESSSAPADDAGDESQHILGLSRVTVSLMLGAATAACAVVIRSRRRHSD